MKFIFFIILQSIFTSCSLLALDVKISAGSAILINAENGYIIYQKNPKKKAYPASTTKIATALYVLKLMENQLDFPCVATQEELATITPQAKKESNYRCPPYFLETDGTHMSIKRGEQMPLSELIRGLLLVSANDAANVIAGTLGGQIDSFVERLNNYLTQIGCVGTHFANPHGLHFPNHYTCAYDLALIAREGMKIPFFRETVGMSVYNVPETNLQKERTLIQYNKLLKSGTNYYSKAIGIKTGYTSNAGGTLVAAAEDKNRKLIAVLLDYTGKSQRFEDAIALFNAAFNEKKVRRYLFSPNDSPFTIKVKGGRHKLIGTLPSGLHYDFYPSETPQVKGEVHWNLPPLPIEKGMKIGEVCVIDLMGNILNKTPLIAKETVKPTLTYSLFHLHCKPTLFSLSALLCFSFLFILIRKNR